jgi:type IV pilus assembly protein PilA
MQPSRSRPSVRGFSLIEFLVVIAIILTILTIAACEMGHDQTNAREVAVVRGIQTINTAQAQYRSQFGSFAASLAQLGPPASGRAGPSAADLIPGSLASGIKGWLCFYTGTDAVGLYAKRQPEGL